MFKIEVPYMDLHAACEPFRLVTAPFHDLQGASMFERRDYFKAHYSALRRLLMREPRGHDDMYGGVLTPPIREDSAFGVLFMYTSGMSPMCGHGALCVARAAVELGLVDVHEGRNPIIFDVPACQVRAFADVKEGEVEQVGFLNDISFAYEFGHPVEVEGIGTVPMDIGYGGAFMVFADQNDLGVDICTASVEQLIDLGMRCNRAYMEQVDAVHPHDPSISSRKEGICFMISGGCESKGADVYHRNFTVFGNRQWDRSPTGTATSALCGLLHAKGLLKPGGRLYNYGPSGIPFVGTIEEVEGGVLPTVASTAFITAKGTMLLEQHDPLPEGFTSRGDIKKWQ